MTEDIVVTAPYFEDFESGQEFDAPAVTLTNGHAALHQAVTGDRLRLALDQQASRQVTGSSAALAHPLLVTNIAIGQSTWASQRAKANLFYRELIHLRQAHLGETLSTRTRVVGLRQNRLQPGRPATGLVALQVITRNQDGEEVLRFFRCPMIPCRDQEADTGRRDDVNALGAAGSDLHMHAALPLKWNVGGEVAAWTGRKADNLHPGMRFCVQARDTITMAPELVRLTLNMAMMHTDAHSSYLDERLVYGGHTLGIAFAQATRALPNLLTILGWESVDHKGPVSEGDRIRSDLTILDVRSSSVGAILKLLVRSYAAHEGGGGEEKQVLDWALWALCA